MEASMNKRVKKEAIEFCSDIRFHRSFILPPNPARGRLKPIRVSYADAGYQGPEPGENGEDGEDVPVMLYIGGMFAGRYQALTVDTMAKDYKVRVLFVDRPGIGGTGKVPLDQRVPTWLDLVPALLKHAGVKHVSIGSHSAGTIYLMNTLLYLRDILDPKNPYVAFFGPWVHPSSSGQPNSVVANMLPDSLIGSFHHLARFLITSVGPTISFGGGVLGGLSAGLAAPFKRKSKPGVKTPEEDAHAEDKAWAAATESLMTKYLFAEEVEGASQEALLCLKKGKQLWGTWENYDRAVLLLARNEEERRKGDGSRSDVDPSTATAAVTIETQPPKLLVHVFFASYDERIGKKGKEFFEACWRDGAKDGAFDFEGIVFADTNHDGVCNPEKGCFDRLFEEIAV